MKDRGDKCPDPHAKPLKGVNEPSQPQSPATKSGIKQWKRLQELEHIKITSQRQESLGEKGKVLTIF